MPSFDHNARRLSIPCVLGAVVFFVSPEQLGAIVAELVRGC